jgi:hypothetical protein
LADNYAEGFMTKSWEGRAGTLLKKKLTNGAHCLKKEEILGRRKNEISRFSS